MRPAPGALTLQLLETSCSFAHLTPELVMDASANPRPDAPERDPVCGMEVAAIRNAPFVDHEDRRYRFCSQRCREAFGVAPAEYVEAKDPVCGMWVERARAHHVAWHEGVSNYFCSERCRTRFESAPDAYARGEAPPRPIPADLPEGATFTCPMHPEVVRDAPGDCPSCGMALEPVQPVPNSGPPPELADLRRRLLFSAPLALAIFVLEMAGHIGLPVAEGLGPGVQVWVQFSIGNARGVDRASLLCARVVVDRPSQPQHVDADRARNRRRLCVQRRCAARARLLSRNAPRPVRLATGLFRGGSGNSRARARRTGDGAARPNARR